MNRRGKFVLIAVCLAATAWALEPVLEKLCGAEGGGLVQALIRAQGTDLFARVSMLAAFLAGTMLVARVFGKVRWAEDRAKHVDALLQGVRAVVPLGPEIRDVYALIRGACGRLLQTRGYQAVWIALVNDDGTFRTAAQMGWSTGFGELLDRMQDGKLPPCAEKALSQAAPVVTTDTVSQCQNCPLHGRRYGRGGMTVRIETEGRRHGVICISAPAAVVTAKDEQAVVMRIAADLAFAISTLETRALHDTAVESLEWERAVGDGVRRAGAHLLGSEPPIGEAGRVALERAMQLTESREGVALFLDHDKGKALTTAAMLVRDGALIEDESDRPSPPIPPDGHTLALWDRALDVREAIYLNPEEPSSEAAEQPRPRPRARRILIAPALVDGALVGLVAVANAPRDYTNRDLAGVTQLTDLYAAAIQRARLERALAIRDTAIAASIDPLIVTDSDWSVTYANESFVRTWGFEVVQEIIGRRATEFVADADDAETLRGGIAGSSSWQGEVKARRADGSTFAVRASVITATDDNGDVLRLIITFVDLTEQHFGATVRSVLASTAHSASTTRDLGQLYRRVRQELGRVMDTRNFFIALYDLDSDTITLPIFLDEKDQSEFQRLPAGRTLTARVIRSASPLLVTREEIDGMIRSREVELVGTPAAQWMGVPLRAGDEIIGVIAVQSYTNDEEFTERHLEILEQTSSVVASAIARERSERARLQGEGRFGALAETMTDALVNTSSGGQIMMWNKAAENTFGYTAAEAIGQPFSLVVPEGFLQAHVDGLMRAVAAEGQGYVRASVEGVGLRKDGSEFPMAIAIGAWKTNDDTYFTAVLRDITSQKQADEELQFLGSIPLQVSDALIVTDLNYRITYVNKAAEFLFGYSGEELIGKTLDLLSAESWADHLKDEIHQTVTTGRVWTGPIRSQRKNGSAFAVEMRVSPLRDSRGRLSSYISIFHDLTERRRAEQLLATLNAAALAMERNLAPDQILDAVAEELKRIGFACAVFLTDGSEDRLTLRYLSPNADAAGAASERLDQEGRPPSIEVDAFDPLRRTVRDRHPAFLENPSVSARTAPGSAGELDPGLIEILAGRRSILAPLIAGEAVTGVLSVQSADLTRGDVAAITAFANQLAAAWRKATLMDELSNSLRELKRTQDILLHAQKMEAIGNLAGGVAHDFNNLLTAIKGYAELALDRLDPEDTIHADVGQIRKAADQAAGLTSQLLAFGRQQPLQPKVLDVNTVITGVDKMLRRLIGEDVELRTELDGGIDSVKADPTQVQQVIMNLAINARDAMPGGGTLTIKTENVSLSSSDCKSLHEARPGRYVRLSVRDTGSGIEPEVIDRIFEPFFSTKEIGKGTGLGLSVVYGVVSQHEGWIDVDSEVGKGTTFHVYLPVTTADLADLTVRDVAIAEVHGHGERVLVVEDEEAVREFATRALRDSGYSVLEAANAEEALAVFEQEKGNVDIVFSDVVLPSKSGLQLADELLARHPDLHVLLSSGYTDQKSQWSVIQERGYGFVQKPYAIHDLLRTIREVIGPN
jgi:PAS domain S-box-containing protein